MGTNTEQSNNGWRYAAKRCHLLKTIILPLVVCLPMIATGCAKRSTVTRLNGELTQKDQQIRQLQDQLTTQQRMNEDLQAQLSDLTAQNRVLIETNNGLTHITLDGAATFASASASLTAPSREVIDRIWGVVGNYPDRWVLIEGHADNRRINRNLRWKYPSNWELSSARAHAVLHYILDKHGADPRRMKVVGYGDQHPVADNASSGGRSENRRVVITIGSKQDVETRYENSVSLTQ
jgi:chemotaxis protein MotB